MATVTELTNRPSEDEFLIKHNKAVIFFGSATCPHCRNMIPVIDKFSKEFPGVAFAHVETTRVKTHDLPSVPVFALYKDNVAVGRVDGASPHELRQKIEKL